MAEYVATLLPMEQVEKLTTQRLLAYYKKHGAQWTRNDPQYEDYPFREFSSFTKEDFNKHKEYWKKVKEILSTRENITTKKNNNK